MITHYLQKFSLIIKDIINIIFYNINIGKKLVYFYYSRSFKTSSIDNESAFGQNSLS